MYKLLKRFKKIPLGILQRCNLWDARRTYDFLNEHFVGGTRRTLKNSDPCLMETSGHRKANVVSECKVGERNASSSSVVNSRRSQNILRFLFFADEIYLECKPLYFRYINTVIRNDYKKVFEQTKVNPRVKCISIFISPCISFK